MASLAEMEQARAERERQETAFREYALNKYGGALGTAFCDYLYGRLRTKEEKEIAFVKAIADKLDSRDSIDKALGVAVILECARALIAPVARRAMDANLRSMPIGVKS